PQRLVKVHLLPCRERQGSTDQEVKPGLQELDIAARRIKLKRIESRRLTAPQCLISSSERPHQDFEPPVLVKEQLRDAAPEEHRREKPDEHRFPGTGRPADEGVPRIATASSVRL